MILTDPWIWLTLEGLEEFGSLKFKVLVKKVLEPRADLCLHLVNTKQVTLTL